MSVWVLAAIAMIAVAVRSYGLDTVPLWTDELFTLVYPRTGSLQLWGEGLRSEATPPLYYSIVGFVEWIAGPSAWAVRLPSLMGSLASVWVAWRLGRELLDARAAALGALLLALAPINVFFAQEARSYALQGAALGIALLGFARFLRDGTGLVTFCIGATLAIWLHPTSVAAVVAFNAAALGIAMLPGDALTVRRYGRWVIANCAVFAACVPLLPAIVSPPNGGAATAWIPALNRWSLEGVIGQTLAGPALAPHSLHIAEIGVPLLVLLALVPPWRPGRRALVVLALVPTLTLALMVAVSVFKPILLSRTLAWLMLPLAVALGGILTCRHRVVAAGGVAVVAGALCWQIAHAPSLKENWPALFAQMRAFGPVAEVVLAAHSPASAVALYAPDLPAPARLDDGGPPMPETAVIPRLLGTPTIGEAELASMIRAGKAVWFVFRRPEYAGAQRLLAGLPPPTERVQSEPGSNPALQAAFWRIKHPQ